MQGLRFRRLQAFGEGGQTLPGRGRGALREAVARLLPAQCHRVDSLVDREAHRTLPERAAAGGAQVLLRLQGRAAQAFRLRGGGGYPVCGRAARGPQEPDLQHPLFRGEPHEHRREALRPQEHRDEVAAARVRRHPSPEPAPGPVRPAGRPPFAHLHRGPYPGAHGEDAGGRPRNRWQTRRRPGRGRRGV